MIVKLLIEGGHMSPSPAIAQKLGPMGINMGQLISKVNDATKEFKGVKVPVEIDIDSTTKEYKISAKSPPVSELLKKEISVSKGSGDHKNINVGNIAIEQVIKIAKTKLSDALERDLKSMVKTVVGNCVSLGIMIENKSAKDVAKEIEKGFYDKEVKGEVIIVNQEKKQLLDDFYSQIKAKQDIKLKQEEAKAGELKAKTEEETVKKEEEKPVVKEKKK